MVGSIMPFLEDNTSALSLSLQRDIKEGDEKRTHKLYNIFENHLKKISLANAADSESAEKIQQLYLILNYNCPLQHTMEILLGCIWTEKNDSISREKNYLFKWVYVSEYTSALDKTISDFINYLKEETVNIDALPENYLLKCYEDYLRKDHGSTPHKGAL
ncbi:MAG: hypothetical protein P4M12_09255 [Gammaproteobacteria bacterium]|nr:hypothetical protein [Gammaproteobacteria bacterium]